jgi:molybdenum cofactor cytidylyltransferase
MKPSAAIVLAAGAGRRMGGPKALLLVDGEPLVCAHVRRLRELGCSPILVVTRPSAAAVLGQVAGAHNVVADTDSMTASLMAALAQLPPAADRVVLVATVDTIPVERSTLRALLTAATDADVLVATPQHNGQSGHPIAIREPLLRMCHAGYAGTLRDIVRSAGVQRRKVEVDDAAVRVDLDTPADLAALRPGLAPRFAAAELFR